MVCGRSVYIPGSYANGAAFLYQRLAGGFGESAVIQWRGETTYRQDASGRPVLACEGSICTLNDTGTTPAVSDAQLSPRRVAFSAGQLSCGFVETAGGEKLRFFTGPNVLDTPLNYFPRFLAGVGYYTLGASFVFVYLRDDDQLGMATWNA
jgi:hypothetical protein